MRFLVADDDPALGMFLTRGLEADGHSVTLANTGQAAVDAFLEETPDLSILDLNLPCKDGTEVLRFLRSVTQDLPILILTGRKEVETRVRCLDLGADDCMLKPFSLSELRARCRALLRRRRDTNLVLRQDNLELNRVEADSQPRRGIRLPHQQGVCLAGVPPAESGTRRIALDLAGKGLEYERHLQHKCSGRLRELSAAKAYRLRRISANPNSPGGRLRDRAASEGRA